MKIYSHNYALISQADLFIYLAQDQLNNDNTAEARSLIAQARQALDEYLNGDNMVEDDDQEDGWVKASDIDIV